MFYNILWILLINSCNKNTQTNNTITNHFTVVLHGGAGAQPKGSYTAEQEKAYNDKLQEALRLGYEMLTRGDSAIDVVETVIKVMEDSPLFNAGKGSVLTSNGKIKMDAAIMDGSTLDAGAVTNVRRIKNPISAAKAVMQNSKYIITGGSGAESFAKSIGLEMIDTKYFYTNHQIERWVNSKDSTFDKKLMDSIKSLIEPGFISAPDQTIDKKYGTVGCVVLDKYGNLAAGTSTGGLINKKYNRIGDSPIIGAGTYANNHTCAISCTGSGEDL